MRQEASINFEPHDPDSIYSNYLDLFVPVDFVKTERYPYGRCEIIKLADECWEKPEESFVVERLGDQEYLEMIRDDSTKEYLLHPDSYTKLVSFMQRTGMISIDELVSPIVFDRGGNRFGFDTSRISDGEDYALRILGEYEILEDEKLWERLEQDAVAYDDAVVDTFVGLRFRGNYLKEILSRIRQEGKQVDTKKRVGVFRRFFNR